MLKITLVPAAVQTSIEATGESPARMTGEKGSPGTIFRPLRIIQMTCCENFNNWGPQTGGSPANTFIAVNGFQGASKLPPKRDRLYRGRP